MQTHLAWSCDSTSWLSGIRFGSGLLWTSRGLKQAHVRSPRFLAYQKVAIANAPVAAEWAAKQSNPRYYLDCLTCAFAYTQYQKWLDTQFAPVPMRGAVLPGGPVR